MTSINKSIQVTTPKDLAERISLLRKMGSKSPNLRDLLVKAIGDVCLSEERRLNIPKDAWMTSKPCPVCSSGVLYKKTAKKKKFTATSREFYGCCNYPKCKHSESIK